MVRSIIISNARLITKNLYTLNVSTRSQNIRRAFCNLSSSQELPSPPPPPPSSPWKSNWSKWTAGSLAVTTAITTLLQFKEDVDLVMGEAEKIIDAVEVVSEAVDMVAEKIVDNLPDGSKLKTTVEVAEEVAETVAGNAKKVVAFINEVQEAEKKLSPVIEPIKQLTQVDHSEAS